MINPCINASSVTINREFYHATDSDRKLIRNEISQRSKSWSWCTAFDADSCFLGERTCSSAFHDDLFST